MSDIDFLKLCNNYLKKDEIKGELKKILSSFSKYVLENISIYLYFFIFYILLMFLLQLIIIFLLIHCIKMNKLI